MKAAPHVGWEEGPVRVKQKWTVQAVVVGPQHLDGLAVGSACGSDPTEVGARVCAQLPHNDSPFGDFYLIATPAIPDPAAIGTESAWIQTHTLLSRVQRSRRRGPWAPGRWRLATSDARFRRDWPMAIFRRKLATV